MKHNLRLSELRNITRLIAISILVFSTACKEDDTDVLPVTGKNQEVFLSSERGTKSIMIASDADWSAEIKDGDWATICGTTTGNGNGKVLVDFKTNIGFPRKASMIISASGVADTIELKQYGITPVLEFITKDGRSPGAGTDVNLGLNTNLTPVHIHNTKILTIKKDGLAVDWIQNVVVAEDQKSVTCDIIANAEGVERSAILRLRFVDAWGVVHNCDYSVVQPATGGTSSTKDITFEELKAMITEAEGELEITGDLAIKGVVVSDAGNENVSQNLDILNGEKITGTDYTDNYKTAYLQSVEATHGVCLKTVTKEDNILRRYGNLRVWLKGLTLVKASNPDRYTLKQVTANHYISITKGDATTLVKKEKTMADLTDADIYTFVTLTKCEFPIREGSYSWLNEGYTYPWNQNYMNRYPFVVRDICGLSMYMMTNTHCLFRRDGSGVPQGAGSISGIIVNEMYERFVENGDIGKYQIRPLTKEDIAVTKDLASGYSTIIVEWAKYEKDGASIKPTMGAGKITHSANAVIVGGADHSYVGPILGTAADNKGAVSNSELRASTWWNGSKGNSWVISFQPTGITGATQLSLNIVAHSLQIGSPRYWVVEWSDHGIDSGVWNNIAEYTLPDAAVFGATIPTQIAGHKNFTINLPIEMLKKKTAYVRLRVAQNKAGTNTTFDGAAINNAKQTAIAYLSIRYNK